jgi:hypothetical protein
MPDGKIKTYPNHTKRKRSSQGFSFFWYPYVLSTREMLMLPGKDADNSKRAESWISFTQGDINFFLGFLKKIVTLL